MDLSISDVRAKIDFLQPSDRQNFANALGQTCIHDLRLRLTSKRPKDGNLEGTEGEVSKWDGL